MSIGIPSVGGLGGLAALIHSNPQVRQEVTQAAQGQPGIPASLRALMALQDAVKQEAAAKNATMLGGAAMPTVAQGLEAEATKNAHQELLQRMPPTQQQPGIAAAPSNLPTQLAGGGIVAFVEGGSTDYQDPMGDMSAASDDFDVSGWLRAQHEKAAQRFYAEQEARKAAEFAGLPPEVRANRKVLEDLDTYKAALSKPDYSNEGRSGRATVSSGPGSIASVPTTVASSAAPKTSGLPAAAAAKQAAPTSQVPQDEAGLAAYFRSQWGGDHEAQAQKYAEAQRALMQPEQQAVASQLTSQQQGLAGLMADRAGQNKARILGLQENDAARRKALRDYEYSPGAFIYSMDAQGRPIRGADPHSRQMRYIDANLQHANMLHDAQEASTTASIADLNAMSALKLQIIAAENAGNHTMAAALKDKLASLEKSAVAAGKSHVELLTKQEATHARRDLAAARRQDQNNRIEDRAELQANTIRAGKEKQAMDLAMKAATKAKADPLRMAQLKDLSEEEIASQMYPKILADLSGKPAAAGDTVSADRASKFRVLR
jgi:hypothetical protein